MDRRILCKELVLPPTQRDDDDTVRIGLESIDLAILWLYGSVGFRESRLSAVRGPRLSEHGRLRLHRIKKHGAAVTIHPSAFTTMKVANPQSTFPLSNRVEMATGVMKFLTIAYRLLETQ